MFLWLILQGGVSYSLQYHGSHDTCWNILYYITTVNIATVSDQFVSFLYEIVTKNGQNGPLYIELQWKEYCCRISEWSIFYPFSTSYKSVLSLYFISHLFEAVKAF